MKQLVVLSGKGGTGKTSFTAALARLACGAVVADADVDAPNLHLLLPTLRDRPGTRQFAGGSEALIDGDACNGCGECVRVCRFDAIALAVSGGSWKARVDPFACEGCELCTRVCPTAAITTRQRIAGTILVSETAVGPLVHAHLRDAAENSGRLVSEVRRLAVEIAIAERRELVLVDGPPGIGCPAISSLTGADGTLLVTEPSAAGIADLERVAALAAHFRVPAAVVLSKADLWKPAESTVCSLCASRGLEFLGTVPYDPAFHAAARAGRSVVELGSPVIAGRLLALFEDLKTFLARDGSRRVA